MRRRGKRLAGHAFGLLAAVLIIAGGVVMASGSRPPAAGPNQASSPATSAPAAGRQATPIPARGSDPARLGIPVIGVDAAVEPLGLTSKGDMDVPRQAGDVGWNASGPQPGQPGDAVIDGHLDWTTGPAVFWNLYRLRPGDGIEVTDREGHTLRFRVTSTARYPADKPPPADLFTAAGQPRLSLITCAGDWNGTAYSQRLVVTATGDGAGG